MAQIEKLEHVVYCRKDRGLIEQFASLYTELPLVIRKRYAHYLEQQNWQFTTHKKRERHYDGQMETEGQGSDCGVTIFNELMWKIGSDMDTLSKVEHSSTIDMETLVELNMAKKMLQNNFENNTGHLLTVVQDCLQQENQLLTEYMPRGIPDAKSPDVDCCRNLHEQLNQHEITWMEIENIYKKAVDELEKFTEKKQFFTNHAGCLEEFLSVVQDHNSIQNGNRAVVEEKFNELQREIQEYKDRFLHTKENILEKIKWFISSLNELYHKVLALVQEWKQQQKMAYVRAGEEPKLDPLINCCSRCGLLINKVFDCITSTTFYEIGTKTEASLSCSSSNPYPHPPNTEPVRNIRDSVMEMFENFLQGTFVVSKQPPELLKMSSTKTSGSSREFATTVRILAAEKMNIKQQSSEVQAAFYFEMDLSPRKKKTSNKLEKNSASFEANAEAKFTELKVIDYVRDDSKLKVWQKRYRLIFTVNITFNSTFHLKLETMSLPFVLNTGSSQECSALGALTWYCYNCDVYDLNQVCPNEIPWEQAIKMLNSCIMALGGRGLTDDENKYLAKKMTGKNVNKDPGVRVSFINFCESHMMSNRRGSKDIPFFKWFQAIRNLLADFLLEPWKDGVIKGFVSGKKAEKVLCNAHVEEGTFFLRFSETYISGDFQGVTGGIVAVIKLKDKVYQTPPRSANLVAELSLYSVLKQFINMSTNEVLLKKIHPSRQPFEKVFEKYNTVPGEKISMNYHYYYPGWKQFWGIDLSKLHLNEPTAKTEGQTTESSGTSFEYESPPVTNRLKATSRRSKAKDKSQSMDLQEVPKNIPNFSQIEPNHCQVSSDYNVQSDSGLTYKKESGQLQVRTKASLKRRKVNSGSTSGGTMCVNEQGSPVTSLNINSFGNSLLSPQLNLVNTTHSYNQQPDTEIVFTCIYEPSSTGIACELSQSDAAATSPILELMRQMSSDSNSPNVSSVFSSESEEATAISWDLVDQALEDFSKEQNNC